VNHRGIRHNRLSGEIEAQVIRSKRYNSIQQNDLLGIYLFIQHDSKSRA
jgi:hypothetical protein